MGQSYYMQPIEKLADYFGGDGNPIIVGEFHPDRGWVPQSYRKRASRSYLRKLKREGVTHVSVARGDRVTSHSGRPAGADFSIAELLR